MGFFSKLFSSDHRAAAAAEAAGDFELAAQRFALAGLHSDAVRMHMVRADRSKSRSDEVDALRDALHWAKEQPELSSVSQALGKALLAQAQAEGIKTSRDSDRVREAAELLTTAQSFEHAGDAFTLISDNKRAAQAYKQGGLIAKLERSLSQDQRSVDKARSEKNSYADYDIQMRGGNRDAAAESLRQCLQNSESQSRYRRLLDELESRLITGGRVVLKKRNGQKISYCAVDEILLGRDSLCDLVLRTGGVSRRHASIQVSSDDSSVDFALADAGSRNGTRLGGIEIAEQLPLRGKGMFLLGDHAEVHFALNSDNRTLALDILKGIDKGTKLRATSDTHSLDLQELDLPATLHFRKGRPMLRYLGDDSISLDGESVIGNDIQLIHGDLLHIDGVEIEIG